MGSHWRGIGLAVLFLVSLAPSSHAFIFIKGATYQKGERPVQVSPIWPTRILSFVVNTDPAIMGGSLASPVTGAQILQSAQEAANAWNAACRADFKVLIVGTTSGTYNSSDAINVIQWDNRTTGEGNYYGAATSTLAAATTVLRGLEFADCDIVLNGNSTTVMKFNPALGEADLRSVLTHEIGHCIGLDHPIEPPNYTSSDPFITGATMVQTGATGLDPSDPGRRQIAQDDRDGIECIYERGKPLRTGLHCGSYSGTNGQGALTGVVVGGPTVVDTGCGGDAQGRNAYPSLETGDGCITSSIASTERKSGNLSHSGFQSLGGTWGFLLLVAIIFIFRLFRRRIIRQTLFLPLVLFLPAPARAVDIDLTYSIRKINPTLWNSFAGMNPGATAWDSLPTPVNMNTLSELRGAAFEEFRPWGKWGGSLSFTLPTILESTGKAQGAALQTKRTSITGLRIGPDFRWFPNGVEAPVRWFVGGRFGVGIFYGNQTFTNPSESRLSYRAWSTEFALSTGAEIPLGPISIVLEGGYSRLRSSNFTSTGNSGASYSDFPSGIRVATNSGSGTEDLRFNGSGLFATVGLQMTFGSSLTPVSEPHQNKGIDSVPESAQPDPVPLPQSSD